MKSKPIAAAVVPLVLLGTSVSAHADWSSRSEVGFVSARGNTSTETANAKFEIAREVEKWKNTFGATGLYGKSESIRSAQRWDANYQTQYAFSERSFWFGSLRYENDRFSGFQYQGSVSTGVGRKLIDTEKTKLTTQIGAGYRALRPEDLIRDETGEVIQRVPGERDRDIVVNGALTFDYALNDSTQILDSLVVESGEANTQTKNDLTLQVKMTEVLALGLGLSVRNNSNPQPGLKNTDTLTTVNLVYQRAKVP